MPDHRLQASTDLVHNLRPGWRGNVQRQIGVRNKLFTTETERLGDQGTGISH